MKPAIGFIGLGTMGKWMAFNLIRAGFPLKFFARKAGVIEETVRQGGDFVATPRDLAPQVAWLVLCLPDTETVEGMLFGPEGIAGGMKPGQILIDCSTIHPLAARRIHGTMKGRGVHFLDAPISGMEARARAGTLTIMVGGEEPAFREVLPALEAVGNTVLYLGGAGSGQIMKMVNNVLFDVHCAALAEILPLAVKMGLNPEQAVAVARKGTGQSFALDQFGPLILEGNFGPGYPLEDAYKDMVHALEISSARRIPLPVTSAAMATYQMALGQGLGRENKGAMVKVWEKVLGVEVRKQEKGGR